MGSTAGVIPACLARSEAIDAVIRVEPAPPRPPLATGADAKQAFVAALWVAWSDSASGESATAACPSRTRPQGREAIPGRGRTSRGGLCGIQLQSFQLALTP